MKSWHYMTIFIVVAVLVGAFLVFNSRTITDINSDVAKINNQKNLDQNESIAKSQITQKKVDVLTDEDLEFDGEDLLADESVDFSVVEELMVEEAVTF